MDRLRLTLAPPRADHEIVRVADHRPQVELDDVERLAIGARTRDLARELVRGFIGFRLPRVQAVAIDIAHDRVGNVVPDRLTGPNAPTQNRRGDRRSSASGRTGLARRPARPLSASSTSAREVPRRPATASVASDSTRSGSRHFGRPAAMSPPTIRNSSLSGSRECSNSRVSTVYDGPSRVISTSETSNRSSSSPPPPGTARAGALGPARLRRACAVVSGQGSASLGRVPAEGTPPGRR